MEPEDYSGFKTNGTDIDEAYSDDEWENDTDVDESIEDNYGED